MTAKIVQIAMSVNRLAVEMKVMTAMMTPLLNRLLENKPLLNRLLESKPLLNKLLQSRQQLLKMQPRRLSNNKPKSDKSRLKEREKETSQKEFGTRLLHLSGNFENQKE